MSIYNVYGSHVNPIECNVPRHGSGIDDIKRLANIDIWYKQILLSDALPLIQHQIEGNI